MYELQMVRLTKTSKWLIIVSGLFVIFALHRYFAVLHFLAKGHNYWVDGGYCKHPAVATDDLRAADTDANADLFSDAALSVAVERNLDLRSDSVYLLVLILSAPRNFDDRQQFRDTFGSATSHLGKSIRTLYVVGRTNDTSVDTATRRESQTHGDLVIFDFFDSYRNLTLKTSLALKWAVSRTRAELIAKVDDDNLFNADRLVEEVLSMPREAAHRLYLGHIWRRPSPIRQADSKWYVSETEYPGAVYPSYAAGPGYVLSRHAALDVVDRIPTVRRLTMEDTFVGICAYLSCLTPVHSDKFRAVEIGSYYDYCTYAKSIIIHRPNRELRLKYWHERLEKNVTAPHTECESWWRLGTVLSWFL